MELRRAITRLLGVLLPFSTAAACSSPAIQIVLLDGGERDMDATVVDASDASHDDAGPCSVVYDVDGDQEIEARCGGTDCDDRNARIGSRFEERCLSGADDDCDGDVDESACTPSSGAHCETALPVTSAPVVAMGQPLVFELPCAPELTAFGVVARLDLSEASVLDLVVTSTDGASFVYLMIAADCSAQSLGSCDLGATGVSPLSFQRALEPGRHFVIASTESGYGGALRLTASLSPR